MRHLALLRGINVNGHRIVPMADLRHLCAELGWTDIQTYIQSGNVLLTASVPAQELSRTLQAAIAERFGFDVPVAVLSLSELDTLVSANPFVEEGCETKSLYVTVFAAPLAADRPDAVDWDAFPPERGVLAARWAYLHLPNGYHAARLNNAYLERRLGVEATTRNWKTMGRLAAMGHTAP